nr:transposase [Micromonospora deserti]
MLDLAEVAHSDKEGDAPTYKHTYGFHPILVTCDNTGELLAMKLRPGNTGANTTTDHLDVLEEAITQIPAVHALDGDLARAEPKRLRYRILHTTTRLARGQRRRWLRIPSSWPWAGQLTTAFNRIAAIPSPD